MLYLFEGGGYLEVFIRFPDKNQERYRLNNSYHWVS